MLVLGCAYRMPHSCMLVGPASLRASGPSGISHATCFACLRSSGPRFLHSLTSCADSMVMEQHDAIRSASHCLSVWLSYLLVMALASHVLVPCAVRGWHIQHGLAACACHGCERGCADQSCDYALTMDYAFATLLVLGMVGLSVFCEMFVHAIAGQRACHIKNATVHYLN